MTTIDAMGTQKAIVKRIIDDGGADDVLALKGNQGTLLHAVIEQIQEPWVNDFSKTGARQHPTLEGGHGRQEIWSYTQLPPLQIFRISHRGGP